MIQSSKPRGIPALVRAGMLAALFVASGCSQAPDSASEVGQPADASALQMGEMAEVVLENDSVLGTGIAVTVRRADGTTVHALFRGPPRLAEVASGGDFEFHEDSLPSRIRLLGPGEELRAGGGPDG